MPSRDPRSVPATDAVVRLPLGGRFLGRVLLTGLLLCVVSALWQTAKGWGWQPASQQLDRILDVDHDLSVTG